MMKNIKLTYQYDGSKFFGLQKQAKLKTVQGEIEKVIFNAFNQTIHLISSGRTDKGVHAIKQVSHFFIAKNIPLLAMQNQLNKKLYGEIKVMDIKEVEDNFHARYDAKQRTYLYVMKEEKYITPFESAYVTPIQNAIDLEKFSKILQIFVGRHDFSSFMKKDKAFRNPVREIYKIQCAYDINEHIYRIKIRGNSYLKSMVRIMIGSALSVYFKNSPQDYIVNKLKNPNQDCLKILAPSEGLYLYNVVY